MISTAQEAHLYISCILNSSESGLHVPKILLSKMVNSTQKPNGLILKIVKSKPIFDSSLISSQCLKKMANV